MPVRPSQGLQCAHSAHPPHSGFTMAARFLCPQEETLSSHRKKLEQAAAKVMKNAHAPYSNFHVGAAILLTNGKIFSGCNVENASYGMTNCAERTAIFTAVAELGPKIEIRAVAVTNDHGVACSPCGACRQVIYEFGPDAMIFFQGAAGPEAGPHHRTTSGRISPPVSTPTAVPSTFRAIDVIRKKRDGDRAVARRNRRPGYRLHRRRRFPTIRFPRG